MISGDKNALQSGTPVSARIELMRQQVDALEIVYMGRGAWWPQVPQGSFDVVTSQDPFWRGLFAWRVAKRLKAKLNIQVHADLAQQSFVKHVLAQIILRHAGSVRVVSQKIQKQVEKMGVKAPVSVLPIFVDISKFSSVIRREHSGKNIVWIGRFEKEKDPALAIDVIREVQKIILDARLIMIGEGSLKEVIVKKIHADPVELPGWQQDVTPFLEKADVVLSTSPQESWGASIIEALAAKVPVVAPDVGVAKEAGAVIAPREKLAEAVVRVLQSGEQGALKINMPSAQEYATLWRKTL